ncbi:hypothetical protein CHL76_07115 [Marinococcus halophilus]|uniref:HD family phosphohydrolase n=1 Tax=Marinococcus halophilus TaxID=1371 RepID=A0A510Y8G9_MARHA|nr:HD domain-containing phosphohydrolase [Marinococcus halophilus]OZT80689.1 hypothetical protein CHL76_07115 [Marinococcus halophilus]GEK59656.1 HD family phosphohydrolase [Marinococcus halophilus]
MRIHINQAVPGCVLVNDVFAVNETPVVRKQTALTEQLVEIIKQFLIEYIEVKPVLVNGDPFSPVKEAEVNSRHQQPEFEDIYDTAVEAHEAMWRSWKAGGAIEMTKARAVLAPLLESLEEHASSVFTSYQFIDQEKYDSHHAIAVALLAAFLAKKHGCSRKEWAGAALAGLLCDASLARNSASGQSEADKHPIQSYQMAKAAGTVSDEVLLAILQHHEREDGSGYPLKMKSGKIYVLSSLVAAADMYHAMAGERLNSEGKSAFHVMQELAVHSFGKLPPAVIETLTEQFITVMTGKKVQLADGRTASIVHLDRREIEYPLVQLDKDKEVVQLNETLAIHHVL